jgi:formate dehydrogenase subunit gamma
MKAACRHAWQALAAMCFVFVAGGAIAQQTPPASEQAIRQETQPLNNAPMWRDVRSEREHYTSIKAPEAGVLIQSGGETWRQWRVPIAFWGGILIALAIVGIAGFYLIRGPLTVEEKGADRRIERFRPADRYAHWLLAITWVVLAVTGLVLSFGKDVLLPVFGYTIFAWFAALSKNLHNFAGPILIVAVPWMFARYVRDNGIGIADLKWFTHLGDYFRGHEYPSHRFNAGEKLVFWFVLVILSTILIVTGLVLDFPNYGQSRRTMQIASMVHMIAAYVAMALACVHIYLGTIGMSGAYRAMREGYVSEAWAQHHHLRWYEDVKAGTARQRFAPPLARAKSSAPHSSGPAPS